MFIISEPRRFYSSSPLEIFLEKLLRKNNLSIRDACKVAGCSPSVLHGWVQGAYPTGTVIHLKKLCNHYKEVVRREFGAVGEVGLGARSILELEDY